VARCVFCIDPQCRCCCDSGSESFLLRVPRFFCWTVANASRTGAMEWEVFERRTPESSAVPSSSSPSHYSAIKLSGDSNSIKYQPCPIRSLLSPPPVLSSPLLPNVAPWLLRRSRRRSFLFGSRVLPWIPIWFSESEGSRCEFGWLARAVSPFSLRGTTVGSFGGMCAYRGLF